MRTVLARLAAVAVAASFCASAYAQPPGGFGGRGGRGSGGPGGSFDPAAAAEIRFKGYDKDGDGFVTRAEVAGSKMEKSFDEADSNHDGKVSLEEYKPYMIAMMSKYRGGGGGGRSDYTPPVPPAPTPGSPVTPSSLSPPQYDRSRDDRNRDDRNRFDSASSSRKDTGKKAKEVEKPFVVRYGNLPKEVPSFFHECDGDQDGMIGLYEWRRNKDSIGGGYKGTISEFVEMDLNGDGYLTADEYIRYSKAKIEAMPDSGNSSYARLRGEPIEKADKVQVKTETPRTETASGGKGRQRGQRSGGTEGGNTKRNPFFNR